MLAVVLFYYCISKENLGFTGSNVLYFIFLQFEMHHGGFMLDELTKNIQSLKQKVSDLGRFL